jgi:hypothetical protein
MEAIHERKSLWHNVLSGAILGYVGVSTNKIGVPILTQQHFMMYVG